jgi:hypothetical protein
MQYPVTPMFTPIPCPVYRCFSPQVSSVDLKVRDLCSQTDAVEFDNAID